MVRLADRHAYIHTVYLRLKSRSLWILDILNKTNMFRCSHVPINRTLDQPKAQWVSSESKSSVLCLAIIHWWSSAQGLVEAFLGA